MTSKPSPRPDAKLLPAAAALAGLALAACFPQPEETYLRTEFETRIDIVGFFNDSSVLVERLVTQVDWYHKEILS